MKFLITKTSPAPCHFFPLRSKGSSQHPLLKHRLRPGGLSSEIKVSTLCHLATSQAVVSRSEIKVTFDLQNFSFASSPSHIWVTNPYPQHGDINSVTTNQSRYGFFIALSSCVVCFFRPVNPANSNLGFIIRCATCINSVLSYYFMRTPLFRLSVNYHKLITQGV